MQSQGQRTKGLVSLLGEGTLRRGYYECDACKSHACPKDELLHVKDTSFTPGIRRVVSKLASLESFNDASEDMSYLCGIDISTKEVERIAEAVGAGIKDGEDRRTEAVFSGDTSLSGASLSAAPIPRMYIEFDGTGIPMTRQELEGRAGKHERGVSKTREAKLGCVFTQSGVDKDGNPYRDKNSTTYFGAIECAEDFGRRLYAHALTRGVAQAKEVTVIGDGAKWIWNLADLHFAGATQIVDMFHAKEHIASLVRLTLPDEESRKRYQKKCYTLLEKGDIETLIEQFYLLPVADVEQKETLDREAGYFRENAHRMQYATFKAKGMFVGSGIIEAGCKNVIGKRLKQSGMHWSVRGANAIIALRCSILSGTFDADFESLLAA
jgi:hypothetical protein